MSENFCVFRSVSSPASRRHSSGHLYKRYWMCAILILVGLFTLIAVFSWLGRIATDSDPNLNIHNNPNVRVQSHLD